MASPRSRIRVFLADEHRIVREALTRVLSEHDDLSVVGGRGSIAAAVEEAEIARPDVIVLELDFPDGTGGALIRALRDRLPAARRLVLSAYNDEYRVSEALRAGADGYLLKTARVPEILKGIRDVVTGVTPLSSAIVPGAVKVLRPRHSVGLEGLTRREREVLVVLANGASTQEAARRLHVSTKTIETHRIHLYAKLGARSRIELTRIAIRAGLSDVIATKVPRRPSTPPRAQ